MTDLRGLLRLSEPRVLAQQLALVFDNLRSTFWAALGTVALVRLSLAPFADSSVLNLWALVQLGIVFNIRRMVSKHDRQLPLTDVHARRLVGELLVGSVVGGVAWSSLLWVLPSDAGAIALVAVYALLWALQSGAVSTMSPVLPLFLAFMVPSAAGLVLHAGTHGALNHAAVVLVGVLFFATLLDQGLRTSRAARQFIQLHFENDLLLVQVRNEHEMAVLARQEAQRASAAKSRVLAAASHDLRQPVHAQGLFLELLAATDPSARQRDLIERMQEAVSASSVLLGTLFDYSRIEAGVIEPRREATRVQPLLNLIEREFGPQADAKGLVYRTRESTWVLDTDPALLELMLRNLVSNAIRYTSRGGLLVACRRRQAHAVLEVWDTGSGIAAEHQGEVFREFHQLGNPERDRHKGFGLGLAIVDGLARALGHQVSLRSVPGRGSVFRVRLPLAAADARPKTAAPTGSAPRVLDAHVLLLDDDAVILVGMSELLRSWGCTCDTAETIEQAQAQATLRMPDLLISDHRLREERNGLKAIAALHATIGRSIPTVLLTGDTGPERLREAAAAGIPVLHKPIAPGQLYRELAAALASDST